jgi:23S rRNA-/tRNA-specific pseudouridylate synthase
MFYITVTRILIQNSPTVNYMYRQMISLSTLSPNMRSRSTSLDTTTITIVQDDPCWGSPTKHSLVHLLDQINRLAAILYESEDYIVVNKPPDLRMDGAAPATLHKLLTYWYPAPSILAAVAAAAQHANDTTTTHNSQQELLLDIVGTLHQFNCVADNELRPVHQLDYATSGALLIARNKTAANQARQCFEDRNGVHKQYLALVHGHVHLNDQFALLSELPSFEQEYRAQRGKRKPGTFQGYLPASSLYQHWSMKHQKQQHEISKKASTLSENEWKQVWSVITPEQDAFLQATSTWRDVKDAKQTEPLERAANIYNEILRAKQQQQHTAAAPPDIPTVFRLETDTPDTFYVFAPLATNGSDFTMFVHPNQQQQQQHAATNTTHLVPTGDAQLDYKPCLTKCVVLKHYNDKKNDDHKQPFTKVRLEPLTGRRHQLRVHMAILGHAIVGDCTYSSDTTASGYARMCLHAHRLTLEQLSIDVTAQDPFPENDDGTIQITAM